MKTMTRNQDLENFLARLEEQVKPMDEIVDKWHKQKLRILEEGILSKIGNLLAASSDINTRFGRHAGEFFRLRNLVRSDYLLFKQKETDESQLIVMTHSNQLRDQGTLLNEAYSDALGKNLVDEGLGEKVEALEKKNKECVENFIKAQQRINQLETYMRIHNLNPEDATDTIVSDPNEGGGDH